MGAIFEVKNKVTVRRINWILFCHIRGIKG
jgi:hypothetical protein